ncbi:MFS transporter [Niabella drilacis]|uniref:Maltose/moltooligosaccharide transporter n=1 Tax=Niabella drilacis (strain DSM 25811 / CCM 8410 / CCUG 62505 / LMG 26954 / E90) TaxID=1285928 RepID=A0A1G6LQR6_NIADE|nr:MFS transporter [Niabella drilacis]SDC45085.1 maltose/moltooligosaccharide transporter [Niabella drilacis]
MAATINDSRPKLSLSEIINMSVGFFGIQFGWDLQRANMGRIYENLGANPDQVPLLFLAAPLTGLLVQPVIGYLSDKTWHPRWGRRRPYFMIGALISSIALLFMPHSSALWMAAGLLWVLDVFGNVAMEPFRAFVTDKLPDSQVNRGFIMQSFMIGLGGSIASALPWMMKNLFHFQNTAAPGDIPENVKWSFYLGAFFFLASVLYTVFTSKEYPPQAPGHKEEATKSRRGFGGGFGEIMHALRNMPPKMRIISLVQFFTWPGLFLMWFYYTTAVAVNVFGGKDANDPVYAAGADFGSLTLAYYSVVTFLFALVLPVIADRLGRKATHALCLLAGALGLISVAWVTDKYMLFVCMTGVGIAWASILSMPYAMLSGVLPKDKVGIYMGIFNFFIVLPEIIASLGFGWLMRNVLHNDRLLAVQVGGALMIVAAVICFLLVKEGKERCLV